MNENKFDARAKNWLPVRMACETGRLWEHVGLGLCNGGNGWHVTT